MHRYVKRVLRHLQPVHEERATAQQVDGTTMFGERRSGETGHQGGGHG